MAVTVLSWRRSLSGLCKNHPGRGKAASGAGRCQSTYYFNHWCLGDDSYQLLFQYRGDAGARSIRTVPIYKDGRKSRRRGKSDSLERFHKSGSRVCFFDGNLRFVKRNTACADCVFAHAGESYSVRLYMERSVISQNAGKRAVLSVIWCRTYYTPSYGIAYRAVLPEMAGTAVKPDQSGSSGDSGICMDFEWRLIYPRKSMDSISAIILLYDCHIHKETDRETGKCKDKCRSISGDIAFCLAYRYKI